MFLLFGSHMDWDSNCSHGKGIRCDGVSFYSFFLVFMVSSHDESLYIVETWMAMVGGNVTRVEIILDACCMMISDSGVSMFYHCFASKDDFSCIFAIPISNPRLQTPHQSSNSTFWYQLQKEAGY